MGSQRKAEPSRRCARAWRARAVVSCVALTCAPVLQGQRAPRSGRAHRSDAGMPCKIVCAPSVTLMPAVLRTHVRGGPLVENTTTGVSHRLPGSSSMEIIVAVASRTAIPHVSLFGSVQWLPNATAQRNPFTLYSANELGAPIRANAPTLTIGASAEVVPATVTRGWFDLSANVGDLFSQAARPNDVSSYTHKLDLDLVAHAHAFAWTPPRTYLHRVSVFGILDYVATGLPRAGDEVPVGRRFLSDARPLAFIAGLALPITSAIR
jgi:hypothetical protein